MTVFFWRHDLDPDFPMSVLEHESRAGADRMHWHDYLEIVLCLEGSGRFLFGRREYSVEPGDIVLVDNAEPHVALPDAEGSLRLLLVLFKPELIAAPGCREFDSGYLAPFRNGDGSCSNRIPRATPLAGDLAPALREVREVWDRHDPADRHLLDASLRRVLGLLVRHRWPQDAGADVAADRHEQVRPVLDYVREHLEERITLERVAACVHMSSSRVRHLFKDVTGVGFKEYVTNLRLAEARRQLVSTDANICEIAGRVGYTNIRQFYTVFHRYVAMSPAEYRRYYVRPGMDDALLGPLALGAREPAGIGG